MESHTKEIFKKEIDFIDKEIKLVSELVKVNEKLHEYNWIFLHPYSQVMDIGILKNYIEKSKNPEEDIFKFFATKFLNLRATLHLIEGFFSDRPILKDYVPIIKESLVLCLQKDFRGSIYILLPVIEGVLRDYLIKYNGSNKNGITKMQELIKALDKLKEDYISSWKKYLKEKHKSLIQTNSYFDENQEVQILKKHSAYFEIWINQFKNYIVNNLYKNTLGNEINDNLNRHSMFHLFDKEIEYSFRNYLRIFHCVNFLSWAIGVSHEECSSLSTADETYIEKEWKNYFNILMVSEATTKIKGEIYKNDIISFKDYLQPECLHWFKISNNRIKRLFL